jgi:hypothetical protein
MSRIMRVSAPPTLRCSSICLTCHGVASDRTSCLVCGAPTAPPSIGSCYFAAGRDYHVLAEFTIAVLRLLIKGWELIVELNLGDKYRTVSSYYRTALIVTVLRQRGFAGGSLSLPLVRMSIRFLPRRAIRPRLRRCAWSTCSKYGPSMLVRADLRASCIHGAALALAISRQRYHPRRGFPTSAHLHNWWGGPPGPHPGPLPAPGRLFDGGKHLILRRKSGTGASRADQGGPPHHLTPSPSFAKTK